MTRIKIAVAASVGVLLAAAGLMIADQASADNNPHGSNDVGGVGITMTQKPAPTSLALAVPTVRAKPWHGGKWKVGPGGW